MNKRNGATKADGPNNSERWSISDGTFELFRRKWDYRAYWISIIFVLCPLLLLCASGLYFLPLEAESAGMDGAKFFWWMLGIFILICGFVYWMLHKSWQNIKRTKIMLRINPDGIHDFMADAFIPWINVSRVQHTIFAGSTIVFSGGVAPIGNQQAFIVTREGKKTTVAITTSQKAFTFALDFMLQYLPHGCCVDPLGINGTPFIIGEEGKEQA